MSASQTTRQAEPRRVRGHLPWDATELRLRVSRSSIIATTRPDGRPHAMAIWFCWLDGHLYFITARSTQNARNLATQPWAVVHVGDGDDVLFVEGETRKVTDESEQARVDDPYRAKYVDPVSGATASIFDNPEDDLYRLDPARVVTWMYGTVAGWTEWRFGPKRRESPIDAGGSIGLARRPPMTDATAVPINLFENDRELMVVAPMPGVAPEDISVDVTDDGQLTVRSGQHGEGQERIRYIRREWSYGPYVRTIELPVPVDARRANVSYGNGVLSVTFPKAGATTSGRVVVQRTGHTRGMIAGHAGSRGGAGDDPSPTDGSSATTVA